MNALLLAMDMDAQDDERPLAHDDADAARHRAAPARTDLEPRPWRT